MKLTYSIDAETMEMKFDSFIKDRFQIPQINCDSLRNLQYCNMVIKTQATFNVLLEFKIR